MIKTKDEWQKDLDRIERDRAQFAGQFFTQANYAKPKINSVMDLLQLPQKALRTITGDAVALLHWNHEDSQNFRYNSLPMFNWLATYMESIRQQAINDPVLAARALVDPTAQIQFQAKAVKWFGTEVSTHFPWAKANPDTVENYIMSGPMDPMWYADGALKVMGAMKAAPELKRLVPIAQSLVDSKDTGSFINIARPLWGHDGSLPSFELAIRSMAKAGADTEKLARWMYAEGIRTTKGIDEIVDGIPFSQYFKRGNNISSPAMAELFEKYVAIKDRRLPSEKLAEIQKDSAGLKQLADKAKRLEQAMELEYREALKGLHIATQEEKHLVDWAEHNIPRDSHDPIKSFEANYLRAVQEGKAPPVAKDQMEEMKTYIGRLSSGWREGTAWRSQYGTGAREAMRINLGLDPKTPINELPERMWRLPQQSQGTIDSVENFNRWHADVATREKRADQAQELLKTIDNRIKGLEAARSKANDTVLKSSLDSEIQLTKQFGRDVLDFVHSPHFIQYAESRKLNPVIPLYQKALGLYKQALLKFSPGFYIHRLTDMAGSRAFLETGDTHLWDSIKAMASGKPAPARAITGELLNFGRKGLRYNAEEKLSMVQALDQKALNVIGQHHYDTYARQALQAGMAPEATHSYALKHAEEAVDRVHGVYDTTSPVMKVFGNLFMFPEHYIGRMAYMTSKAMEYPSEAYAGLRLRELQQENSVDRRGALPIPFTNLAADPANRMIPAQYADALLHTGEMLTPQQNASFLPAKALQMVAGDFVPPLKVALEHAGALPQTEARPFELETVYNELAKAYQVPEAHPTDSLSHLMGHMPEEKRDAWEERRGLIFQEAARRDGVTISPEEAQKLADKAEMINKVSGFLTTKPLIPNSPGMQEVLGAMQEYRTNMLNTPAELQPYARINMLGQDKFQGLEKVLPLDPASRYMANIHRLDKEEDKAKAFIENAPSTLSPIPENKERMGNVIEALRGSPFGSMMHSIYNAMVPPAGAEEIKPPQVPIRPDDIVKPTSYGYAIQPKSNDPAELQRTYRAQQGLGKIDVDLRQLGSREEISHYIDNLKDEQGNNWGRSYIHSAAQTIPFYAPYADQDKRYLAGDTSDPGLMTPLQAQHHAMIGRELTNWYVNGKGNPADKLFATADQINSARASGEINLPSSVKIDPLSVEAARPRMEQLSYAAQKNYEQHQHQDYPDLQNYKSDIANGAIKVPAIQSAIERGDLPGTFWKDIATGSDNDQNLLRKAAWADNSDSIHAVRNALIGNDGRGTPIQVHYAILDELLANHQAPYISALRLGADGGPNGITARLLNEDPKLNTKDENGISFIDRVAPINREFIDSTIGHDFRVKVGLETNPVYEAALKHVGQYFPDEADNKQPVGPTAPATSGNTAINTTVAPSVAQSNPTPPSPSPQPISRAVLAPLMHPDQTGLDRIVPPFQPKEGIAPPEKPFASAMQGIEHSVEQWGQLRQTMGDNAPSLAAVFATNLHTAPDVNGNVQAAYNPSQLGPAIIGAGHIAESLGAFSPKSTAADVFKGVGTSIAAYGATASLAVPALATGLAAGGSALAAAGAASGASSLFAMATTIGAAAGPIGLVVAAGLGIYAGIKASQSHGNPNAAAFAERQEEMKQAHIASLAESTRRYSISEVQSREQNINRALVTGGGMSYGQARNIEPQLKTYRGNPTWHNRIGLVDTVERTMNLKPNF